MSKYESFADRNRIFPRLQEVHLESFEIYLQIYIWYILA